MNETGASSSLKRRSVVAMLWSGADLFMRYGVQLVVAVVLARLLSPEEFGTIALLYLFTGIASVFIDSGFSSALIQKQDTNQADESTVFWINLAMGFITALTLWLLAPWIAQFFGYPILMPLTGMLAISVILNALGSIHLVFFSKRLEFRKPMFVSVGSAVISGVTAIVLANNDYGVWALAWQSIVASLVSSSLLWVVSPWRPAFVFSITSAKKMFRFGGYLMLSGLLDITYNRLYSLLIGKFYGVRDLAYFNRADNTKQIPVDVMSSALSRVAFPAFSEIANDRSKLQGAVQFAVRVMMLVNLPIMFGLMTTADSLIILLFGKEWLPAVPILEVLCIAGMFWPLHVINLNVLKAQGHADLFFRLEVIKKLVGAALLLTGALFGVMGIAWSQAIFGLLGFFINAFYTGKFLDYGPVKQLADVTGALIASIIMGITVNLISSSWHSSLLLTLLLQVFCGIAVYVTTALVFKINGVNVLVLAIRHKRKSSYGRG